MITGQELLDWLPLTALYAETHYRFRYFPFSLYYRRRPEVVFDAPYRLEPGHPLPVSLIIKDGHKFPVEVDKVCLTVKSSESSVKKEFKLSTRIDSQIWHRIFDLDVTSLPYGLVTVEATAYIHDQKHSWVVRNDNYPGLSNAPLQIWKAADPLPTLPGWVVGELHCHSDYGGDQVEFGAPLEVYQHTAPALGLGWIAVTDHSYNLDDLEDSYLINDPDLRKWHRFLNHVDALNQTCNNVIIIPGEELTCRSGSRKNIHLLLIGQREFLPGSGDGAQEWLKTHSELSVIEALSMINPNTFAAAAHPYSHINWLERFLVRRCKWENDDLMQERLNGWQIQNGVWDKEFEKGLAEWEKALNLSEKRYIFAGNDAHGNLNRFRQVRLPMITLWENHHHLFGKVNTRVKPSKSTGVSGVIEALKSGRAVISDGPALEIGIIQNECEYLSGSSVRTSRGGSAYVTYITSSEFGEINQLRILTKDNEKNLTFTYRKLNRLPMCSSWQGRITFPLEGKEYIRAEISTVDFRGQTHRALTNPIWLID